MSGSVAVEPNHSSSAVIYTHASSGSNSINNRAGNVSYWEWEWHAPSHIGDTKAQKGYE